MRRGFTLIELIIAVGLSGAVCLAAWSALRLASGALTVVNRLSTENGLLREGMSAALEELDHWTSYDHPDDTDRQPLRAPGRPFAELDFAAMGFDTDFDQSDPKTWFRGAGSTTAHSRQWGDFAQHAGLAWADADPARQHERRWTANLLRRTADHLGYYALFDYLPAGTIMLFHDERGELPREFWDSFNGANYSADPATCIKQITTTSGEKWMARDTVANIAVAFTVTTNPDYLARDVDHHYFWVWKHIDFFEQDLWHSSRIHERCGQPLPLLPVAPASWPGIQVVTHHNTYSGRCLDSARVIITSPLTGQRIKLFLSSIGTTLRGARRQRGLDVAEVP